MDTPPEVRLSQIPKVRVDIMLPEVLRNFVDNVVSDLNDLGERTSRSEIACALIWSSRQIEDPKSLLIDYRTATVNSVNL